MKLLVSVLVIVPTGAVIFLWVAFLKVVPGVPPHATLAIQRGELIDVRVVAPHKGEHWLRLHMVVEDGQEVSAAVRHSDLLQKIADISAIRELSPGERLTLYTSGPYSFAGMGDSLSNVWQIDTNAGTALSYAQAAEVWRTHRRHGFIMLSLLSGVIVPFSCFLSWGVISNFRGEITRNVEVKRILNATDSGGSCLLRPSPSSPSSVPTCVLKFQELDTLTRRRNAG